MQNYTVSVELKVGANEEENCILNFFKMMYNSMK